VSVLLFSCKSKSQTITDAYPSLRLFQEGSDLAMKGYEQELKELTDSSASKDSLSAKEYYEQAIRKFVTAYQLEPTIEDLGIYLSGLYYNVQKFDSALLWAAKRYPSDSLKYSKSRPTYFAKVTAELGFYYLNVGDYNKGSYYLQKAYAADTTADQILANKVIRLSNQIYYAKYPGQISDLKSKNINPCLYSAEILQLVLLFGKSTKYTDFGVFNPEEIKNRRKNCR
jgi:hypothetical protein